MSYIRTKDNIFEVESESDRHYFSDTKQIVVTMNGTQHVFNGIDRKDVIAQADTIDKLCDELVCDERLIARFCNIKETIRRLLSEGKTVYGAIWIKGKHGEPILKSVAKMNEKEEFELL